MKSRQITTPGKKTTSSGSDKDDNLSITSGDIALSPKLLNQKCTPPTIKAVPQRKSTRNRQSALSTAFGNPNGINNTNEGQKTIRFEIDSPPDKTNTDNYPSLKSLIQEMGFTEKIPQYQACGKFIEVISPKNNKKQTDVVDLTSPTEDETNDKNNDILFVMEKNTPKKLERKQRQKIVRRRGK